MCHEQSKPALKTLEDEGFRYTNEVDILMLDAWRAGGMKIRTVRLSRKAAVTISDVPIEAGPFIICTTGERFMAVSAPLQEETGKVRITRATAETLQVTEGEAVRYIELKPRKAR